MVTTDLGKFGVFTLGGIISGGGSAPRGGLGVTPEQAQEIERLGYGTIWVAGSPAAELSFAEPLLQSTTALKVATGIVNIWSADRPSGPIPARDRGRSSRAHRAIPQALRRARRLPRRLR
jgi:hypothetical protein